MLLSIGNYSYAKNERFVLDAYTASRERNMPLVFVGQEENAYLRSLRKSARRRKLGHLVFFFHGLSKQQINWLYNHARLFLTGSRTECQPLVVLDAMAAGVPFISTDVGCVSQQGGGIIVQ